MDLRKRLVALSSAYSRVLTLRSILHLFSSSFRQEPEDGLTVEAQQGWLARQISIGDPQLKHFRRVLLCVNTRLNPKWRPWATRHRLVSSPRGPDICWDDNADRNIVRECRALQAVLSGDHFPTIIARRSLTFVSVGPVTTRSPIAAKNP